MTSDTRPGLSLDALPDSARTAWLALRDELRQILGDDVVAMWAHGGTVAIQDPPHEADLDTYVVLARAPAEKDAQRIEAAHDAIGRDHEVEWDAWYILADDATGAEPPRHAFREGRRDTSWAIHRAHWLAGRFANLHGPEPSELVQAPTWEEIEGDLDRELEHVERHVAEGDTDSFEATYALLTGSRILHALATRDVVISKRAAGDWALADLPRRWQATLQAAMRTYEGHPASDDADTLAEAMAPFVTFVRERMPLTEDRSADGLPRWSGY